jgi:hypothetical protein
MLVRKGHMDPNRSPPKFFYEALKKTENFRGLPCIKTTAGRRWHRSGSNHNRMAHGGWQ